MCGKPGNEFICHPNGKTEFFCKPCFKGALKVEAFKKKLERQAATKKKATKR